MTASKTLLAAALLAVLLAGCASTLSGNRGRTRDVSDARLEKEVRLALLEKLGEDVLGVTVDAAGGRVLLAGAVDERSTQELAEEVAKSVPGVRRVDNRLVTRQERRAPGTPVGKAVGHAQREVDDAVLEMRVGKNLLEEIGRYAIDVEVEASDGVVSLRGILPDRERKSLALHAAEETSGVGKVVDLLRVQGL